MTSTVQVVWLEPLIVYARWGKLVCGGFRSALTDDGSSDLAVMMGLRFDGHEASLLPHIWEEL